MADWADVRRIALALAASEERSSRGGLASWWVRDKMFAWERPLRPKEALELGDAAPSGPILAARVEHLGAKQALLACEPELFFATSHFDGHPSVLGRLPSIPRELLEEVIVEAWLARAPRRLADDYLATRADTSSG